MDRKRIITLALLLAGALSAHALNWDGTGLRAAGTAKEGQRTIVTLKDAMDRTVQVSFAAEPDDRTFRKILELKDTFVSWSTLNVTTMRFTVTGSNLEAVLALDRVVAGGKDISQNVPAGLYFTWTGVLSYDFRMVKDNVFLRITGYFTTEKDLVDKMLSAIANPAAFLRRSDPEYYIPKVEKLETDMPALQALVQTLSARVASLEAADRAAAQQSRDLSARTEAILVRQAELADGIADLRSSQQALSEASGILSSRLESLKGRLGDLDSRVAGFADQMAAELSALAKKDEETVKLIGDRTDSLAAGADRLRRETEALRYATMTFHNVEWLFWQVPVPKDGLAKALELKAANPAWGLKELAPALKEAGLKITDQQINLILAVYYNEFPK